MEAGNQDRSGPALREAALRDLVRALARQAAAEHVRERSRRESAGL